MGFRGNEVHAAGRRAPGPFGTVLSLLLALAVLLPAAGAESPRSGDRDAVFQVSTINALLQGIYDGELTCGDLLKQGDFGLGTFQGLDGEMVALDGRIYQARADGSVHLVAKEMRTPFAVVKFFKADKKLALTEPMDLQRLEQILDAQLPTRNVFYAFKVQGTFAYVKTRSVPRQSQPYPPLSDVARNQPTFEFRDVKGTLVGFRVPDYLAALNVPGYHLHFLSDDRKSGAHLLAGRLCAGGVIKHTSPRSRLRPPGAAAWGGADLRSSKPGELEQVEKGRK